MRLFQSGGGDLKETSLKITSKDIERGSAAFEKKEGRDSMYRVASFCFSSRIIGEMLVAWLMHWLYCF